ncbi:MAG: carboxylesterase family protein [Mycetocola sp.]
MTDAATGRSAASPSPRFEPPCGPIIGWRDGEVIRATGIRYAVAERFAEARPVADHTVPVLATGWSAQCPQPADPIADEIFGPETRLLPVDENCQNLSITRPVHDAAEPRPVLVWVHGGGFVTGAGDQSTMDPARLVTEQGVVVVSVNYRLGLFGFTQTPEGPKANRGLTDLREAFRWIARNIAAFGGDPVRVTAVGQSAGASALVDLIMTENASALFSRAIIQSAPLGIMSGRSEMNRATARHAAGLTAESSVAQIRQAQAEAIAAGGAFGLKGGMPIAPQYGYAPLPEESARGAAIGANASGIEVLIGSTSEEARLFLTAMPGLSRWTGVPGVGRLIERAVVSVCTRLVYGSGVRRFARGYRRAGGRVSTYRLSWAARNNPLGSAHTIDIPLLFGDESAWSDAALIAGTPWAQVDADGVLLREAWASFARGERISAGSRLRRFVRFRLAR